MRLRFSRHLLMVGWIHISSVTTLKASEEL
jgi:hypothetical protein